jgi:hypothetical protein
MSTFEFDARECFGRLLKTAVVILLLPVVLGLLQAALAELGRIELVFGSARDWLVRGFLTYLGMHLIIWRPEALFRFSHRVFALLAVWLFGGQVASVEQAEEERPARSKRRGRKRTSAPTHALATDASLAEGSPLVAFSPYVIPFYSLLICGLALLARYWTGSLQGVAFISIFGVGFSLALHWVMTADDLQEQRELWHLETYLLAVVLIVLVSATLVAVCLPWVLRGLSTQALFDAAAQRIREIFVLCYTVLFVPQ